MRIRRALDGRFRLPFVNDDRDRFHSIVNRFLHLKALVRLFFLHLVNDFNFILLDFDLRRREVNLAGGSLNFVRSNVFQISEFVLETSVYAFVE